MKGLTEKLGGDAAPKDISAEKETMLVLGATGALITATQLMDNLGLKAMSDEASSITAGIMPDDLQEVINVGGAGTIAGLKATFFESVGVPTDPTAYALASSALIALASWPIGMAAGALVASQKKKAIIGGDYKPQDYYNEKTKTKPGILSKILQDNKIMNIFGNINPSFLVAAIAITAGTGGVAVPAVMGLGIVKRMIDARVREDMQPNHSVIKYKDRLKDEFKEMSKKLKKDNDKESIFKEKIKQLETYHDELVAARKHLQEFRMDISNLDEESQAEDYLKKTNQYKKSAKNILIYEAEYKSFLDKNELVELDDGVPSLRLLIKELQNPAAVPSEYQEKADKLRLAALDLEEAISKGLYNEKPNENSKLLTNFDKAKEALLGDAENKGLRTIGVGAKFMKNFSITGSTIEKTLEKVDAESYLSLTQKYEYNEANKNAEDFTPINEFKKEDSIIMAHSKGEVKKGLAPRILQSIPFLGPLIGTINMEDLDHTFGGIKRGFGRAASFIKKQQAELDAKIATDLNATTTIGTHSKF